MVNHPGSRTPGLRLLAAGLALTTAAGLGWGPAATGQVAGEEPSERTISIRGAEPRDDVFVVRGRVSPAYQERRVTVQRKLRGAEEWKRWRVLETGPNSFYRTRVKPLRRRGVVCYRMRIRGTKKYAEATSDRVCIRTYWK